MTLTSTALGSLLVLSGAFAFLACGAGDGTGAAEGPRACEGTELPGSSTGRASPTGCSDVDAASDAGTSPPGDASAIEPDGSTDGGAESAPRDPYQAAWQATADQPTAAEYLVDKAGGTVTDKRTGLVWSRAAITAAQLPPGSPDPFPATQLEARAVCEAVTLGGAKGWRLPTRIELLSIVTSDESHTFDPTAFVATDFDNLPVWVATDDASRNAYYEAHYHLHTFGKNLVGTWASAAVLCVKAPYPVTAKAGAPPPSRFTLTDGVLKDSVTKLEWSTAIDAAPSTWAGANALCANRPAGGGKPWRLPRLKEAASLWNEASKDVLPPAFAVVGATTSFWTATTFTPSPGLVLPPGYFRLFFDKQLAAGDFYWAVGDFAATACVRDG